MSIPQNLAAIHERIARAASRAGRNPSEIALMAVTKTHPAERIVEAYEAGHRLFGENRVQEFAEKYDALSGLDGAEFHMIGHLQSNKASKAVEVFHAIDSLDSAKLGDRLNAAASTLGKTINVLIEINIGGEEGQERHRPRLAGTGDDLGVRWCRCGYAYGCPILFAGGPQLGCPILLAFCWREGGLAEVV